MICGKAQEPAQPGGGKEFRDEAAISRWTLAGSGPPAGPAYSKTGASWQSHGQGSEGKALEA